VSAGATIGGTPIIAITNVAVLNISNNQNALSGMGWSGTSAGYSANGGWKLSDQYIQLTANINTGSGGIQIYTDNVHSTPAFTGVISSNTATPAGLVDNVNTTEKLPTAWMASTNTYAAANAALTPIDPNNVSGFNWFYHEDKSQVAVPSQNAAAFLNGSSYITVYAAPATTFTDGGPATVSGGVHYASGLYNGQQQFGPFTVGNSVTNIYTEANFLSSLAGRSYNTTAMILEAYSL